jgi:hypothetical protein
MPRDEESDRYHFVGSACAWCNLTVRALAIGHVFVVAALAGFAVGMSHRLQAQFRQPRLSAYTLYLASWGTLAGDRPPQALSVAALLVAFVLKTGIMHGWIAHGLLAPFVTRN